MEWRSLLIGKKKHMKTKNPTINSQKSWEHAALNQLHRCLRAFKLHHGLPRGGWMAAFPILFWTRNLSFCRTGVHGMFCFIVLTMVTIVHYLCDSSHPPSSWVCKLHEGGNRVSFCFFPLCLCRSQAWWHSPWPSKNICWMNEWMNDLC